MSELSDKIHAAGRIVWDVAAYRVKKREAGNLVTSLTLAVAIGLAPGDIAYRAVFGVVLNLFVYLVNDCFDVAIDLAAQGRDEARTRFLAAHTREGWGAVSALGAVVVGMGAVHSRGLFVAAVVNVAVIFLYSRVLKHRPLLDLFAMGLWGASMAMVGFPIDRADGWRLAGVLALLCMVTEAVQVLRDEPTDRAAGVRTTAVVLGVQKTALVARALMVASAVYAAWFVNPVGALFLAGVFVPLDPARATRSWDRLRVIFGLTWLAMLAVHRLSD